MVWAALAQTRVPVRLEAKAQRVNADRVEANASGVCSAEGFADGLQDGVAAEGLG
jgi:hypothetical protein